MSAVGGQRVVKERFEDVVEEIVVLAVLAVASRRRKSCGPVPQSCPLDAEPAFLLEEVEEDDLAHEFLGEVHGADALGLEFLADGLVLGDQFFQRFVDLAEQLGVLVKNSLVTASTLNASSMSRQRGSVLGILKQSRGIGSARCGNFRLRRRCRKNAAPG